MSEFTIRNTRPSDRLEVAELIYFSTNHWYQVHGRGAIFAGGPAVAAVYFDVYEALDPGCGVVAVHNETGRLIGSCFSHPRETHVSLGIMNSHPAYAGRGVARALLKRIIDFVEGEGKPLRLVSSAVNLDSFSLYTRAGFVPRCAFQDMVLPVPQEGLRLALPPRDHVRAATAEDIPAMAELEMEVVGIRREKDYRRFVENPEGFWHLSVLEGDLGRLEGFCASCGHPGCNMIGPAVARNGEQAAALLAAELDLHRGRSPVFLVPVECTELVRAAYGWGARNCEIHFSQVRGEWRPLRGVLMPTFLPETA
jgi:GNAT superfamily N-acetyltransferase